MQFKHRLKNLFKNVFRKKWFKLSLLIFSLTLTLAIIAGGVFVYRLDREMLIKMQQKQMVQPTIFYSQAPSWSKGDLFPQDEILAQFKQKLRARQINQRLFPGDYLLLTGVECSEKIGIPLYKTPLIDDNISLPAGDSDLVPEDICLQIYWEKGVHPWFKVPLFETLWLSSKKTIKGVFRGETNEPAKKFIMPPQIIAQYWGEEPILREQKALREFPVDCLDSIIAIEDVKFLEHKGVSWVGILRAGLVNLAKGRKAQGGSTLTQQLIKNYLLTPEKTLKRKALEFIMALLMESHFDKDLILETYLNIIYMGQQGPYQVRGYGAASRYYFQKPIGDLTLGQCSLLAALVNSPGQYNPFIHPDKVRARRSLVLEKMLENNLITADEKERADSEPLPKNENPDLYSTLPYFLQAVVAQLKDLGLGELQGLKIFTTMDLRLQEAAQNAIANNVKQLEESHSIIKKVKAKKKIELESSLVSVDVNTGEIRAVVGGKSYRKTQFNRVISSRRQVGSTFKPLVYLTALLSEKREYSPLTELKDEPFTYRYGKQKWSPENYDRKHHGVVPMYYALKESLNIPTAQLGLEVGLKDIIDLARSLGVKSDLKPVPSLCLGAFELSPLELLQVYLTLSRFGNYIEYTFIDSIESNDGESLWSADQRSTELKISSVAVQELIGMLKQTVLSGTAKRILISGFDKVVAGKTGTTNDNKDSWFVGFTPDKLTIVWTGYDDNTPSGLTGASGSLPAWISYMNEATRYDPIRDFPWTEEVEVEKVTAFVSDNEKNKKRTAKVGEQPPEEERVSEEIDLIIKR